MRAFSPKRSKALLILLLVSGSVTAKDKPLDVQEMRARFDVLGEIYLLDPSGQVELKISDKQFVTLRSESPFLPDGIRAKVYGRFDGSKRTKRLRSIRTIGSSEEAQFQESMAAKF